MAATLNPESTAWWVPAPRPPASHPTRYNPDTGVRALGFPLPTWPTIWARPTASPPVPFARTMRARPREVPSRASFSN